MISGQYLRILFFNKSWYGMEQRQQIKKNNYTEKLLTISLSSLLLSHCVPLLPYLSQHFSQSLQLVLPGCQQRKILLAKMGII